ncbi:hypothetical protein MKX01_027763 [Papaver californicum]|nr:hypothetical protein MKX01_027763 [Papaver californicum]
MVLQLSASCSPRHVKMDSFLMILINLIAVNLGYLDFHQGLKIRSKNLRILFGETIFNYMIVVFINADAFKGNDKALIEYVDRKAQERKLQGT